MMVSPPDLPLQRSKAFRTAAIGPLLAMLAATSFAQLRVVVVAEEDQRGIESDIYRLEDNEKGLAFGVDKPATEDALQGKGEPTPELVDSVRKYQKRHEIPATGRLDYRTLSMKAGTDIGAFF